MTEAERVRATLCHNWLSTHDIRVKAKIGHRHAGLLKAYLRDMVKAGELEHRHVEWTPGRWCDEWKLKGYAWEDDGDDCEREHPKNARGRREADGRREAEGVLGDRVRDMALPP